MDADQEREPTWNAPDPGAEHDLPGSVEGPDIERGVGTRPPREGERDLEG